MREEIAFGNGRISDFQGLVTFILDRVILHTIMHDSSTSTYILNVIEIKETFCGRTDVHGENLYIKFYYCGSQDTDRVSALMTVDLSSL